MRSPTHCISFSMFILLTSWFTFGLLDHNSFLLWEEKLLCAGSLYQWIVASLFWNTYKGSQGVTSSLSPLAGDFSSFRELYEAISWLSGSTHLVTNNNISNLENILIFQTKFSINYVEPCNFMIKQTGPEDSGFSCLAANEGRNQFHLINFLLPLNQDFYC